MDKALQNIYENHHREKREAGFSILKEYRGIFFSAVIGQGKTVLDIGCRDGALTAFFAAGNQVLGADIDQTSLQRAADQLKIETIIVDLNGSWTELAGRKFDFIVAGEIIEHLYYPEEVVKKVKQHLNPGGAFVGSVPNAFSLINRWRYLFGQKKNTPLADPTHINQFSARELTEIFKKHFNEVEISGLGRHKFLAGLCPELFAFDLAFVCR